MSDFNAAQVLAEAYTLYKKHHDGMGLDFKIAIAQVREESEQRGAIKALRDAAESHDVIDHMYKHFDNHSIQAPASVRATATYLHNRADRIEGTTSDDND